MLIQQEQFSSCDDQLKNTPLQHFLNYTMSKRKLKNGMCLAVALPGTHPLMSSETLNLDKKSCFHPFSATVICGVRPACLGFEEGRTQHNASHVFCSKQFNRGSVPNSTSAAAFPFSGTYL